MGVEGFRGVADEAAQDLLGGLRRLLAVIGGLGIVPGGGVAGRNGQGLLFAAGRQQGQRHQGGQEQRQKTGLLLHA